MAKAKATVKTKTAPKKKSVKSQINSQKHKTSEQKTVEIPIVRFCSFCGKSSETSKRLIAGPNNVFICDECLLVCVQILSEENPQEWYNYLSRIMTKIEQKIKKTKPKKELKASRA